MALSKRNEEVLLDLTVEDKVDVADAKPGQRWGQPGKCPDCGSAGYLDHIDMVDRIMYQHCTECANKWITSQSETVVETSY